jgi:hypothetical protein
VVELQEAQYLIAGDVLVAALSELGSFPDVHNCVEYVAEANEMTSVGSLDNC